MFAAFIAMINTLYTVFALTFATSATYGNGFSSTFMLWIAIVANLIAIAIIPFWARLSDKVGRKPIFVTGAIGSGDPRGAYLAAIASKNGVLVWTVGLLLAGVVYSMTNAVWPPPTRSTSRPVSGYPAWRSAPSSDSVWPGSPRPSRPRSRGPVATAGAGWPSSPPSPVRSRAIAVATGPKKTHLVPTTELGQSQESARTVGTTGALRTS